MFGIESGIISNDSRAHSGRGDFCGAHTPGIVLTHSALGWVLMAFQAIVFAAQRAARVKPKAERSDALGYGHSKQFAP
jgi:hypothetical protein